MENNQNRTSFQRSFSMTSDARNEMLQMAVLQPKLAILDELFRCISEMQTKMHN